MTKLMIFCVMKSLHPLLRTSQVSLSSNPETDFRYSAIYGTIGVYKGRIFAIKMVNKKSIDMTRPMKKELKWVGLFGCDWSNIWSSAHNFLSKRLNNDTAYSSPPRFNYGSWKMRDLRHDNLSAFFGACVDPPNICIVTEYCTRGSLKVNTGLLQSSPMPTFWLNY